MTPEAASREGSPSESAPRAMQGESIYRAEALAAYRRGASWGSPLHIVSVWARWSIRITVALMVVGLVFAATVSVGDYAEGIAIVHNEGHRVVTSARAGTVQRLVVQPGEHVEVGQVLVLLDDARAQAELDRVERASQETLARLLRKPSDEATRARLADLVGQAEQAKAELQQRRVVAPCAGLVSDVRVQPGQAVRPGDPVVSVQQQDADIIVVGLFPGHYRPLLDNEDTKVRLELAGFPRDLITVELQRVGDEVVGPAAAMRYLGKVPQDGLAVSGPVVLVEASVPAATFESDGKAYRYYDGMQGVLEARLREETLLLMLLSTLRGDP